MFDDLKGLKVLKGLFLTPFGVLYFVFLDLFDAFIIYSAVFSFVVFRMSYNEVKERQSIFSKQIGLDRMVSHFSLCLACCQQHKR